MPPPGWNTSIARWDEMQSDGDHLQSEVKQTECLRALAQPIDIAVNFIDVDPVLS